MIGDDLPAWHSQDRHVVRLEWGPVGARSLTRYAAGLGSPVLAVVVDVLSFTTCVSVAVDRGITVHPYRWHADDAAADHARRVGAVLARPRSHAAPAGAISLSPRSIRDSTGIRAVVLPSPNGSTISALLAESGAQVVAGCLRNRRAVAGWLRDRLRVDVGDEPTAVVVVPAGERWPDGSLRPAVEDLWGAGAVVEALLDLLGNQASSLLLSPEAEAARAAYVAVSRDLDAALAASASGRELVEKGWPDDVSIAAEVDASEEVPLLRNGFYVAVEARSWR